MRLQRLRACRQPSWRETTRARTDLQVLAKNGGDHRGPVADERALPTAHEITPDAGDLLVFRSAWCRIMAKRISSQAGNAAYWLDSWDTWCEYVLRGNWKPWAWFVLFVTENEEYIRFYSFVCVCVCGRGIHSILLLYVCVCACTREKQKKGDVEGERKEKGSIRQAISRIEQERVFFS